MKYLNLQKLRETNRSQWLLPIYSGIFIGTSYIPFPPWASLFCLVPLWLFWQQQQTLKPVLLSSLLCSFIYTLIGFNWITYTVHEFAKVNWFFSAIVMLLFGWFGHLFLPIAGCLWFWSQKLLTRKASWLAVALMAVLTALAELYVPMLFKWNFGYSWYGSGLPVYQWAELIGFTGLSMLTILTNLFIFFAWQQRTQITGKLGLASILCIFLGLNAGGMWLKNRLPSPDTAVDTLLVQANIGNFEKQAMELGKGYRTEILKKYLQLTADELAKHPHIDFVMWSETAFPALLGGTYNQTGYAQSLQAFFNSQQVALLTGAYAKDSATGLTTNSLFLVDQQGTITEPHYSKTILLALGEYLPGEAYFPWLREILPMTGHFARGPGPTLTLKLHDFIMGPQICYESLFPEFSKGLADLGAQFIVNVTNDSWYGDWQEPYQHLYMTLARGIEFRRPVLRVTNTGISTVALANGDVLNMSPINTAWAGAYHIPFLTHPVTTFYQRHFYLMPTLLWSALIILLGLAIREKVYFLRQSD